MELLHHRTMTVGPELELEAAVFQSLPSIMPSWSDQSWSAGSARIGAGLPDILIANWRPELAAVPAWSRRVIDILTYFKSVARAKLATAAEHLRLGERSLSNQLASLVDGGVLGHSRFGYFMTTPWRRILTEVTSVEVKVGNWKQATAQARRNQLFVDRSYVALPAAAAARAAESSTVSENGIGVIAIRDSSHVSILRRARARPPRVWAYYFRVAALVAEGVANNGRYIRHLS